MKVIVSLDAKQDLIDIYDYIAADNRSAAARLLERFEDVFGRVAAYPDIGRARPELREHLRSIPEGSYIVFYRRWGTNILVVRILHAARDIDEFFS